MDKSVKWKYDGVRVVHSNELDVNTAQTPGMNRAAAITHARAGAEKLWAGTVVIHPKAKTGAHHHGPVESVIYVVSGKARMRWGDKLEYVADAGPGDFIYVPPYVPHQEMNSATVFGGNAAGTTITLGVRTSPATGAMSRMKSNGSFP